MATIAVDFDGTIVEHRYPEIGKELPFATETLRTLIKEHHRLILWSVREGKLLQDAIDRDYPEEEENKNNHFSRKIKADYFIDDRNIGGLPDWGQIYRMISEHKTYTQIIRESMGRASSDDIPKKRHWWQF